MQHFGRGDIKWLISMDFSMIITLLFICHQFPTRATSLPKCSSLPVVDPVYEPFFKNDESIQSMCGVYRPNNCEADEKIAILIPYRNREIQLRILVSYLTDFLVTHRIYFGIFVIEPIGDQVFNRGKLLNAGFAVANIIDRWDCFFFHDVDLLPTNRDLPYKCPQKGTAHHWSSAIDKFDFKLPYNGYIGGVSAMNSADFIAINGYPNEFWGWGGEDDCFGYRIGESNMKITRSTNQSCTYTMLRHEHNEKGNEENPCRNVILGKWKQLWKVDGLNSLNYSINSLSVYRSFYHLSIDLKPPNDTCEIMKYDFENTSSEIEQNFGKLPQPPHFQIDEHCKSHTAIIPLYSDIYISTDKLIVLLFGASALSIVLAYLFQRVLKGRYMLSKIRWRETEISRASPLI